MTRLRALWAHFRTLEDPAGFLAGCLAVALAGFGAAYILIEGVVTWLF